MNNDTPSARSTRQSAGLRNIVNLLIIAAIVAMINYFGFRHYVHRDYSTSQFYTLSPKTLDVLKQLDSPISAYTFLDSQSQQAVGQAEQINNLLKEYQQASGKNFTVERIDPAYDIARATELQKELHFDGNDHLVIFKYKDKPPRFVKEEDLYDMNPMTGQVGDFKGEQVITAALIGLVEGKPSLVYFTEGHGEHSPQDDRSATGYGLLVASLKNENIEVESLNLAQKGEVPDDADAVVIAGPSIAFSKIEADALAKYVQNNGKLLVLLDPYVQLGLDDLLKSYGISYDDDLVLYRAMSSTGVEITVPLAPIYQGGFSAHPITTKFAQANLQLLIYDARSITLPPSDPSQPQTKIQFLLQTLPDAWGWIAKGGSPPADPKTLTYNKNTDIGGPVTIAAVYDGGPATDPVSHTQMFGTRIVAVGCAKFLENDTADPVGSNFFTNSIDWLVKKNAVLDIAPKKPQEYGVYLNAISYRTLVWSATCIIPGIALVLGVWTWFSRRK
jgi:ABC-type uncharacterized transport system involved in gliding motility auxiliary subunit